MQLDGATTAINGNNGRGRTLKKAFGSRPTTLPTTSAGCSVLHDAVWKRGNLSLSPCHDGHGPVHLLKNAITALRTQAHKSSACGSDSRLGWRNAPRVPIAIC